MLTVRSRPQQPLLLFSKTSLIGDVARSHCINGALFSQRPQLFLDISIFFVFLTLIADRVACRDLSPIDACRHGWLVHDPVQPFFTTFYQLVS